jgi:hypothetical protein
MFLRVIALLVTLLVVSAAPAQETSMVPVMVDGQTVHLEMRIYKPSTEAKAPTLVFNLTFRTLCHTAEAILEEPSVEGGSGAIARRFHAL